MRRCGWAMRTRASEPMCRQNDCVIFNAATKINTEKHVQRYGVRCLIAVEYTQQQHRSDHRLYGCLAKRYCVTFFSSASFRSGARWLWAHFFVVSIEYTGYRVREPQHERKSSRNSTVAWQTPNCVHDLYHLLFIIQLVSVLTCRSVLWLALLRWIQCLWISSYNQRWMSSLLKINARNQRFTQNPITWILTPIVTSTG